MSLGRRYWAIVALFSCALLCATHYQPYPNEDFKPSSHVGNKFVKQRKRDEKKARKQAERDRKVKQRELDRRQVHALKAWERTPEAIAISKEQHRRARAAPDGRDEEAIIFVAKPEGWENGREGVHTYWDDEGRQYWAEKARGRASERERGERKRRWDSKEAPFKKTRKDSGFEVTEEPETKQIATHEALNEHDATPTSDQIDSIPSPPTPDTNTHDRKPDSNPAAPLPSIGKPRNPEFCLIHSFARDNSLLPHLISFLPLPSIISLYAISKPFHFHFNNHHTANILASVRTWAPDADTIFPWRCYNSFCIKDPAAVTKIRMRGRQGELKKQWDHIRDVPSLRWLQMVVWREGVVQDMLIVLRTKGLICSTGTLEAVKRMWFIMDFPLNSQRLTLIRSKTYVPDRTLKLFSMFLLKVDMHLTDPLLPANPFNHPNRRYYPPRDDGTSVSGVSLRKLLLAERQMTPLWRVIRGWTPDVTEDARPMTRLDMLRLWVRHKYKPKEDLPEWVKRSSIMGIPWFEVGTAGRERTGLNVVPQKKAEATQANDETAASEGREAVLLSNTAITPTASTVLQKDQFDTRSKLQTQRRASQPDEALPSDVASTGRPRELLLGPDELVMRESLRRGYKNHEQWAKWMLFGFCTADGRNYPLLSEEQWYKVLRTPNGEERQAAVDLAVAAGIDGEDTGEDMSDDDDEDMSEDEDEDMSGMSDMSDSDDMEGGDDMEDDSDDEDDDA